MIRDGTELTVNLETFQRLMMDFSILLLKISMKALSQHSSTMIPLTGIRATSLCLMTVLKRMVETEIVAVDVQDIN